jgi:head-to-tail connecting protein
MENKVIVARAEALAAQRGVLESKWNDIDRLILPLSQGNFALSASSENEKNWDTKDVWDSTAPIGAERLASVFHSGLLSGRWFGLSFRDTKVNQDPAARQWIDDVSDVLFDAIMTSNFLTEMATGLLDFVGYGNFALTQELASEDEKVWKGFEFTATALREVLFEQDYRGRVYRWYRPVSWTATQIVSKFRDPEDPSKPHKSIPEIILQQAESAHDEGQKHEIVFCIYPRPGVAPMSLKEKTRTPERRPFGYKYVLKQGLVTLGDEGGMYDMTAYMGRYSRAATSQWGFGPGLLALPTVKLLNALQEDVTLAAGKVVDPATLVTERGLLGDLDLAQGGLTVVRSMDDIAPYESKARFDVSDALISDLRMMVRKLFREDDISLKESPQMTATEVIQRVTLLNRLFAPQSRRIQSDIFSPTINNSFGMMYRADQLPKVPDSVMEKNPRIQIDYFGPMMRAQRDDEVVAIERIFASVAANLKMGFESIKDDFNPAGALREMSERLATPGALWFTKEEAAKNRKEREQREQAAMMAQIKKTDAEGERAAAGAEQMRGGMM